MNLDMLKMSYIFRAITSLLFGIMQIQLPECQEDQVLIQDQVITTERNECLALCHLLFYTLIFNSYK